MPLVDGVGGIRNSSVNIAIDVKQQIDSLISVFERFVADTVTGRGLRRAIVRSHLDCNATLLFDRSYLYVAAERANGMPTTNYLPGMPEAELSLAQVLDIAVWDLGYADPFAFRIGRSLLDLTGAERQQQVRHLAEEWVDQELERTVRMSQLV